MPARERLHLDFMHSRLKRALQLRRAAKADRADMLPFVNRALSEFPWQGAPYATTRALLDACILNELGKPTMESLRAARAFHRL